MGNTTFSEQEILSEFEIIEAAKLDSQHFGILYKKFYKQIFKFVYRRVDELDASGDITQDVFLEALNTIKRYEYRGVPFTAWLYRIATSRVNMHFRANKSERNISLDSPDIESLFEEMEVHETNGTIQKLQLCLKKLDQQDVQLLELRFKEACSFKEIGEILDITENNAKVKTYRLLDKIKKILIK